MIPIRDQIPTRHFPIVNYLLIAANILVFIIMWLAGSAQEKLVYDFALIPANISSGLDLGDFSDVLTSMFMHAGLAHLAGNMLYLWIFGDNVEDRFGHVKFIIFYLLCGLAATFAQLAFSTGSDIPNLGASGAIAGVLGAYIILFPQGKIRVLQGSRMVQVSALIVIGLWIVLQLFSSIGSIAGAADTGGVAYMAHIGGFIAGIVLTFLFGRNSGVKSING